MKKSVVSVLVGLVLLLVPSMILVAQEDGTSAAGCIKSDRYGKDSITCVMNISLYREFFKQWKASNYTNETFHDAINPWRWVFLNCPRGTENTYIDGVKMMNFMIESAQDPVLKNKYIDTLMMIYDQRIQYFGKEGYVLGRKGVDLSTYRPEDFMKVYETLKKSVELEGNKTAGPVLIYYMKSAVDAVKAGKADTAIIFDTYDISESIIEFSLDKNLDNEKELANWQIVQGNIEAAIEPFSNCKDLTSIYRKKYEQNPDNIELMKKISEILDRKKCQEDRLYFEVTERLYSLEPSPEAAYLLGKMLLKQEKYADAVNYLKQAEKMTDSTAVKKSYRYIAMAYRGLNNYPSSRAYALKAIAFDPSDGEPYILIGDMYAESAKDCGDNDLTKRVAYWAAVDKYIKAKQVDPSKAEEADARISSYSKYFPSMETIFFYNLKEGDMYRVECWINEDTRVRASKE